MITIQTIPHSKQRYETVGDWYYDSDGNLIIRVSKMSDWRYEFLVALHELIEVMLCKKEGISQKQVDDFDMSFEGHGEPGDHPTAPYKVQHCIATGVERIVAAVIGVEWSMYEEEIYNL